MSRTIAEPVLNEHGDEEHPAFGMIGASRMQISPPGATLFDSDIQHQHSVIVRLSTASRRRELNRDWLHATRGFVEVEMSEAQWASFVSSMNTGDGVPCTIRRREGEYEVSGLAYEPRLAESMSEVRAAGDRVAEQIRAAFDAAEAKPTKANMHHLKCMIDNAAPNMEYAAKSLSEHAENVVQRARADIEAMVLSKAHQLGLDPGDLSGVPQLGTGEESS